MHLTINGDQFDVGQLGMDFVILKDPVEHAPGEAELYLSIDGQDSRRRVYLSEGLCPECNKTRISPPRPNQ
jgi:hypothetical protein